MVDPEGVEHRCRRGRNCPQGERQDHRDPHTGQPITIRLGAPIHAPDGLCRACERHTTDAIADLPRDFVELHRNLAKTTTTGGGEPVSGTAELPVPIRLNLHAIAERIHDHTLTCVEPVAEKLGITWDTTNIGRHTRPGHAVQRACRVLAPNLPVLLNVDELLTAVWNPDGTRPTFGDTTETDGVSAALELHRLHRSTQHALGRTRLAHRLPFPCPSLECETPALVRLDGADQVRCEACGRAWGEDEWRRLCLIGAHADTAAA